MSSKRKKRQAHLTFEPTGDAQSPDRRFAPAKVRYSKSMPTRSSLRSSKSASQVPAAKKTQESLEDSLGKMKPSQRSSPVGPSSSRVPVASFMPRIHGGKGGIANAADSSDEDIAAEGAVERGEADSDEDDGLPAVVELAPPPRSSPSVSTRLKRTVISDDDEDDEVDEGNEGDEGDEDEEDDEDDLPIVPSFSRRRRTEIIELDSDSNSEDESPAKKRKTGHPPSSSSSSKATLKTPTTARTRKLTQKVQPSSSPTRKFTGHRTEKQKTMELLRRRRAGEKINQLTSSESETENDKKGLYDSDGDDGLQVLKEFSDEEDDDEDVEEEAPARKSKKAKSSPLKQPPKKSRNDADNSDSDLDDFVVEDDDGPIGAPANLGIPLEFTAQAHKPLKEQFPHVIEWLVHNRINPAFERKDPVYNNAWRKLDDEVRGLATSKFTSSAWKPEFYRTLKGRPRLDAWQMDNVDSDLHDTCEACGRSGHPATWKIIFQGHPYYKDTLVEVESDSEDSNSDSDASSHHESVDSQGNPLPPATKEWVVGSVCCSNAETAHSLIHWKHALKEWVEDRLEAEGHMTAKKLKERDKMKAKKRRELANQIVDAWQAEGTITSLYGDFKLTLENARNKSTTGGRGRRWK